MYGMRKVSFLEKELEFACVSAVNGILLREFDPERSRICLVNEMISEPVRRVLSSAWTLVETNMTQETPPGVDRRRYQFPTWEGPGDDLPGDLSDPDRMGRKARLWALDLERALFLDADYLFINHTKTRDDIAALWKLPMGRLYAKGDVSHGSACFNSGFMLFEPNERDAKTLNRGIWDASVFPNGLAHCPGHDQRIITSVFADRWTNLLAIHKWSSNGVRFRKHLPFKWRVERPTVSKEAHALQELEER